MPDDDNGPDLRAGVPLAAFDATPLVGGKVGDADVVLVRTADGFFALDGKCTHSGAPLAKGLLVGEAIRCPWHHACFDARTGAATAAPALLALGRWRVEQREGLVAVAERLPADTRAAAHVAERIVIVGAGAGGAAAAAALVALGHGEAVTLIGNEADGPYDRTALSKHFLSGQGGDDILALNMADLAAHGVDVRLGQTVTAIEPEARQVCLLDGEVLPYAKLILATGAEPKRLTVPGAELPHVRVLRSLEDARGIIDALPTVTRIVVVGGSFIAMEAAAALRDRQVEVAVVTREKAPFARTLGPALSDAIMAVHREHGTVFHLGRDPVRIEPDAVHLEDGTVLPADLVIVGVGVSPRTALAERAGLMVEDGVVVDERLRTSHRDIYAVGDIARWPDPHSGESVRVEHWTVAQRQGQIAAANAVGLNLRYDVVPFFWTLHFDFSVRVVGHATAWDTIAVDGDPARKAAVLHFRKDGRDRAVATVERDSAALDAEVAMERRLGAPAATLPIGG